MPKPIHSSTSIADLHRAIYAMQDYNELFVSAQSVPTASSNVIARSLLASRRRIFRNTDFSAATQASLACNAGHGWPQRGRLVTCPTRIHAPRCIGPCAGTCIPPLDKLFPLQQAHLSVVARPVEASGQACDSQQNEKKVRAEVLRSQMRWGKESGGRAGESRACVHGAGACLVPQRSGRVWAKTHGPS